MLNNEKICFKGRLFNSTHTQVHAHAHTHTPFPDIEQTVMANKNNENKVEKTLRCRWKLSNTAVYGRIFASAASAAFVHSAAEEEIRMIRLVVIS